MRHEFQPAGFTLPDPRVLTRPVPAVPLSWGRTGFPLAAQPCRCERPIDNDGTCLRCGRDVG